jgi:hypothetical protein
MGGKLCSKKFIGHREIQKKGKEKIVKLITR